MYNSVLDENIHDSPRARARFQSVMRQILWTAQSLPIPSLNLMRQHFEPNDNPVDVRNILDFMGALLSGVTDDVTPVRPLHSSFYDFLTDASRNGYFYVDKMQTHLDLALASIRVMRKELQFNVCGLESSYIRNSEVKDLDQRVMKFVSPHLSYACRYWSHHVQETVFNDVLVEELKTIFQTEYILFWMEVLSVLKSLNTVYTAMPTLMEWIAGQEEHQTLHAILRDAIEFVRTFGGAISMSTPHLYLSALAFSPMRSAILKQAMHKFRRLPIVVTGKQENWPTGLHCRGHTASVASVTFSPDGGQIISGSEDKTIRVWDAHSGSQIGGPLEGHTDIVWSVAFSPDGGWIVSGSEDKTIRLWDAQTGSQIGTPFEGHTDSVGSVAFSPDGRWIVSGSEDMTIIIWDAHTGSQIGSPLKGHTDTVGSVAFSPDGRWIVSGSNDMTIIIWDAYTGSQIGKPFKGHTDAVWSVAFSPDGRWIVSGSEDMTVIIWDAHSGSQIGSPLEGHIDIVWSVAFSPDGRCIASGSRDQTIRIWDAQTGSQIGSPFDGNTGVLSVAFSPDGRWIVSGSDDKTIRLWDAHDGSQIGDPYEGHTGCVMSVAFSPDDDPTTHCLICFSPVTSHSLCNVLQLYDGVDDQKNLIKVDFNGWIIGPEGRLLLWIPSYYHAFLYSPKNALVIPRGGLELDLNMMVHGDIWQDCYAGE
ncbi:hypothetical protein ID866_8911 [Astraeus odoratus]|nr:hypothetical protein ID866_8911 [Astraeus odoratus]